jgi:aspartate aminotransferase
MNYYDDSIVCYSYSKSLSLPGERIGYIAVNPKATDSRAVYAAVCGAGRSLGFVCAPALFQRVAAECDGLTADLSVYKRNRDLLYKGLTDCGFTCVYPDGAFYLFVKALEEDANAFCERAKQYELLLVPSDSFGCPGYVRISYCVTTEQIQKSLPAFKCLAESYQAEK